MSFRKLLLLFVFAASTLAMSAQFKVSGVVVDESGESISIRFTVNWKIIELFFIIDATFLPVTHLIYKGYKKYVLLPQASQP